MRNFTLFAPREAPRLFSSQHAVLAKHDSLRESSAPESRDSVLHFVTLVPSRRDSSTEARNVFIPKEHVPRGGSKCVDGALCNPTNGHD